MRLLEEMSAQERGRILLIASRETQIQEYLSSSRLRLPMVLPSPLLTLWYFGVPLFQLRHICNVLDEFTEWDKLIKCLWSIYKDLQSREKYMECYKEKWM